MDVLIKTATSGSNTVLLIQHDPAPPGLVEVKLAKGPNEKLGISIRGGERTSHNNDSEDEGISVKGFHGNPFDAEDEGIFISKVNQLTMIILLVLNGVILFRSALVVWQPKTAD